MFGKLMKYECKSYLKIVFPIWVGVIILGILNGVSLKLFDSEKIGFGSLFVVLPLILYGFSFAAVAVVSYILILKRFWNGLLGREGYLMFTLPVSRDQLILSKLLGAVAVNLFSFVAGALAVSLTVWIVGGTEAFRFLPEVFGKITEKLKFNDSQLYVALAQSFFLCIFSSAASVLKLYAAMAVGHMAEKNRIVCSVGAYIGFGMVIRIFVRILTSLGVGNKVVEDFLDNYSDILSGGFDIFTTTLGVSILIAVIGILLYGAVTHLVICKRLNLE